MTTVPYTYLIGWSTPKIYYYGVRYAKHCHPSDLWVSYFTSSKLVKDAWAQYGTPDIIEIRRTFNDRAAAVTWEHKVLRRLNVLEETKWLNQSIGGVTSIIKQSSSHIRNRTKNKKHNPNQREIALRALQKAVAVNTGKKQTAETQQKKRDTYRKNMEKNKISAQRDPWCKYMINGQMYIGNKSVMEAFGISEPTIYNRVNNPKFDWCKIDG